jgi:glyoxylate reductase
MARPAILVTYKLPSAAISRLEAIGDVEMYRDGVMPRDELLKRLPGKQAVVSLITDRMDKEAIDAGSTLKVIANVAVGYNNIDVPHARSRGIIVTNTPDVLTDATADLTIGLILDITRRLSEGDRLVRAGGWKGWKLDFMLGSELKGRQLGIVGMGRIGQAVAARARVFGIKIAFVARGGRAVAGAEGMSQDRLLSTSDVVSIHLPLTAETRHLIDRTALARMRRSAYLINTSRGPVVDEEALVWALREGIIAGAGLDVYEDEPKVHQGLLTLENVVLAPHLGSGTVETRTAMADLAARNAAAVLSGRPPITRVA